MRIIICGAGRVGWQAARQLSSERHDVVMIDSDERLIQRVNEMLDVQGIVGHASHPDVLDRAGAADADLLIGVTAMDEVNIVACDIARALFAVPRRIARLRGTGYLLPAYADLYQAQNLSIDVVISPERDIAAAALARLDRPGTFDTASFMDGRVRMLAVSLTLDCPVLNAPLRQLEDLFSGLRASVVAIQRDGRMFVPGAADHLRADDRAYLVAEEADTARVLAILGVDASAVRRIVIIGAGGVGQAVAGALDGRRGLHVTLIDRSDLRAERAAEALSRIVVLQGDGMSVDLMSEAGVPEADVVVTLTDDDHTNILAAVRARQLGARRVAALINDPSLLTLAQGLGVDAQVSPQAVTVAAILRHVRRGLIRGVHVLGNAQAELIEAQVLPGSPLAGTAMRDLGLSPGVRIALIERRGTLTRPGPDARLEAGDGVLIVALSTDIPEVERLLQVSADWF